MVRRRIRGPRTATLVRLALGAYLANCALGTAVQTRVLDTRAHRWVHHLLYIVTSSLTAAALAAAWRRRAPQAVVLTPAVVPLWFLARVGHRRHLAVALSAAPFYAAASLIEPGRGS